MGPEVASAKVLSVAFSYVKLIAEQGASLTDSRLTSNRCFCSIDYSHLLGSAL